MPPNYPPQTPLPPQQPQQPPAHPASYDFIMNPGQPAKTSGFKLPGGQGSSVARIALILGGLLLFIILFAIIKSVLIKGPDLTGYVGVAQDQQELIHLFTNATSNPQQTLSTSNQNLAATAEASLSSNQNRLVTYLAANHQKLNSKTLGLKINGAVDTQLTNAQTAGTYDSAFQTAIQSELNTYLKDLSQTYKASSGKNGRALLKSFYDQGSLLLSQAQNPSD